MDATCRIHSYGCHTVENCEVRSFEVWGRHGHYQRYGIRKGGFNRYPGMRLEPLFTAQDSRAARLCPSFETALRASSG
jgi:hypothetical protein